MTNRKFWLGMAVMALVFGFVLTGCPTEGEAWSDVTDLSQLNGTWKGSYKQTMNMKQAAESMGMDWDSSLEAMFGNDMKVTTTLELIYIIDSTARTQASTMKQIVVFSGSKVDDVWPMIGAFIGSALGGDVDDKKHSITITDTQPATVMPDEYAAEMLSALQINENGNKVKIPANALGEGFPEMIMTRQ